jgi:hypothetical protein
VAFAFAIAACLIAAVASLLTGRRTPPPAAELLGAELAGVAGEGGFEPSELVGPEPAAEQPPGGQDQARANGQSAATTEPGGKKPG